MRRRFAGRPEVQVCQLGIEVGLDLDKPVDTVITINALEHIEDDAGALRSLARLVVPGGTIVVWVPGYQQLYGDFDRKVGHVRHYTPAMLAASFDAAGLALAVVKPAPPRHRNRHSAPNSARHDPQNRHSAPNGARHDPQNRHSAPNGARHDPQNRHSAPNGARHDPQNRHSAPNGGGGRVYREALRAILGVSTDAALGFVNARRAVVKLEDVDRKQFLHTTTALGAGAWQLINPGSMVPSG